MSAYKPQKTLIHDYFEVLCYAKSGPLFLSSYCTQQSKLLLVGFGFVLVSVVLVSVWAFSVTYDHTFSKLAITRSDVRPHIQWAVSLVILYGLFNLSQGFVRVCISCY